MMPDEKNRLEAPPHSKRPSSLLPIILASLVAFTLTAMTLFLVFYYPSKIGPAQPIPFDHWFHVTTKQISCVFCHPGSIDGARAGIPPVETCMLCHKEIIITHPQIQRLHDHFNKNESIPWVRVNDLREFVFFNHQVHTRAGFDCVQCHGDVANMDRVSLAHEFKMGFCIQCHRDQEASHDCVTCHR